MTESFGSRRWRDRAMRREGVITGLLGATVVATFYFLVDLKRGKPFMTPSVLGQAFLLHRPITPAAPDMTAVLVYSVFHVAAFMAFGLVLAALTRVAEVSSLARYATVQMLVVFMVLFYGVVSIGSEAVRGLFPFISVIAANGLAGAVMALWLWRHHPHLRVAMEHTPLGASDGRA